MKGVTDPRGYLIGKLPVRRRRKFPHNCKEAGNQAENMEVACDTINRISVTYGASIYESIFLRVLG